MGGDTWRQEEVEKVLQTAGGKLFQDCINMRQAKVAKWGELQPIFEVCAKETGYKGGGGLRE